MKYLSETEIDTLYNYVSESTNIKDIFLQILIETGCRISESLMLTQSSLTHEGVKIKPLKNSNPREVALSPKLLKKLRNIETPVFRRTLGPGSRASHQRAMCRHMHEVSMKLLGRRINLHALRHTAFSRLYVATKDILLVKQWAGHKSIDSTLVYVHLEKTKEADAAYQNLLLKKSS